MHYACYIIERMLRSVDSPDTRLELWTSRPQSTSHEHLRVWGCAAWIKDFDIHKDKLAPTSIKHIFLGVDRQMKCYRLGRLPHYKIVRSAHVVFNEDQFPCKARSVLRRLPVRSLLALHLTCLRGLLVTTSPWRHRRHQVGRGAHGPRVRRRWRILPLPCRTACTTFRMAIPGATWKR